MYYVIETKYVGPNQDQDQFCDVDTVMISTAPAITNSSREERTEGWCGTTNDREVYAHGAYATLEEAEAKIAEMYDAVREVEDALDVYGADDFAVRIYKPGRYQQMGRNLTGDWLADAFSAEVDAYTTDEQIAELVEGWEAAANQEGMTLDSCADDLARAVRDRMREEADEERGEGR